MDINQESLELHYQMHGKIEVISRKKIETRKDLVIVIHPRCCGTMQTDRKRL